MVLLFLDQCLIVFFLLYIIYRCFLLVLLLGLYVLYRVWYPDSTLSKCTWGQQCFHWFETCVSGKHTD